MLILPALFSVLVEGSTCVIDCERYSSKKFVEGYMFCEEVCLKFEGESWTW